MLREEAGEPFCASLQKRQNGRRGNRKQQQMAAAALPEEVCVHPESRTGASRLLKCSWEKGMQVEGRSAR